MKVRLLKYYNQTTGTQSGIVCENLSRLERTRLRQFLRKEGRLNSKPMFIEKVTPLILFALGLFFMACAVVFFSGKPTDYGVKWVLLPGVLGGLALLLTGVWCGAMIRRRNGKSKSMEISGNGCHRR